MSVVIAAPSGLLADALEHLRSGPEEAGFFLADFDPSGTRFSLTAWRPMSLDDFEYRSDHHLTLRDEIRPEIIKWAWDNGACLVEAHSHDHDGVASFSPSDLSGFEQWVPHVRWRLRRRPYAAVVIDGDTIDALAWMEKEGFAQVVEILTDDGVHHATTRRTIARLNLKHGEGQGD